MPALPCFPFSLSAREAVAVIATVLLSGTTWADPGVKLTDIVQGTTDAEQAVKTLSLQARIELVTTSPSSGQSIGPIIIQASYTVGENGLARYESAGESSDVGGDKQRDHQTIAVNDGKTLKTLERFAPDSYRGIIASRTQAVPWQLAPRDYLTHFFAKPVSSYCESSGATLVGPVKWDGRTLQLVESAATTDKNGTQWKNRFHIDAGRQFSTPRRSACVRFQGASDWVEYLIIECRKYDEVAQGIWVPGDVLYEHYDVNPTRAEHRKLVSRMKVSPRNWSLNPDLKPSLFDLKFPKGTIVTDQLTGKIFTVTEVTDQTIDDNLGKLQDILDQERQPHQFYRRLWFLVTASALAVITLIWLIVRYRKSRRALNRTPTDHTSV